MKTLITSFYVAVFIAVVLLGLAGEEIYKAAQINPGRTLQVSAKFFLSIWWLSIAGTLVVCRLSDWIIRRPAFDVAAALDQDRQIHQKGREALRELHRGQSGTTPVAPTEGGQQ